MTDLTVLDCGPGTSVQDAGRLGHRRYGVPTAGAMDRSALAAANLLVGNGPFAAAIEFTLIGGRFRVGEAGVLVAVAGPGLSLCIDGQKVLTHHSAYAPAGAVLEVSPIRGGVYGYLAIRGGLTSPLAMGSRSAHIRSGIGGVALTAGDILTCSASDSNEPELAGDATALGGINGKGGPFRVVPGPQDGEFEQGALNRFLSSPYTVSPQSDRMGQRLSGASLCHPGGHNIVSDGVVPGSVQVPGDGQPIVLMRDAQTTGGYPKIATVISADLGRLAQTLPGGTVRFRAVTMAQAQEAARRMAAGLLGLAKGVHPADIRSLPERLSGENLISGIVADD
ncbi:biotin-dependent carboxyltransferase family protein [Rhodophyticola sp. CCM32]|uniref:5-oxoprolinase subunit C family protein n=1 Tax=Rhodophyticola sp. CCM32 TaxID=2916397 RepID=UPI00143D484E|nr:biotin-dependent carboxyltransferase family protein [Rhodophyticola sp. CCM32]